MLVQRALRERRRVQLRRRRRLRRRGGALVVRDALHAREHAPRAAARREGAARPADRRVAPRGRGTRERVHPVVSCRARALRRRDRRRRGVRGARRSGAAAPRRRRRSTSRPKRGRRSGCDVAVGAAAGASDRAARCSRCCAARGSSHAQAPRCAPTAAHGGARRAGQRRPRNHARDIRAGRRRCSSGSATTRIWVHDGANGTDVAYNWGNCSASGSRGFLRASSRATRGTGWGRRTRNAMVELVSRAGSPDHAAAPEPHAGAEARAARLPPLERARGEQVLPVRLLPRQLLDAAARRARSRARRRAARGDGHDPHARSAIAARACGSRTATVRSRPASTSRSAGRPTRRSRRGSRSSSRCGCAMPCAALTVPNGAGGAPRAARGVGADDRALSGHAASSPELRDGAAARLAAARRRARARRARGRHPRHGGESARRGVGARHRRRRRGRCCAA